MTDLSVRADGTPSTPPAARGIGRHLSGQQKAMIFLVSLEEGVATRIIAKLSDEHMGRLRAASSDLEEVSPDQLNAVHVEFLDQLKGASAASLQGSGSYLRRLAGKALGEGRAAELWSDKAPKGPVAALSRLDAQAIVGMLENEQPQTVAVILTQFDAAKASDILKLMPTDQQADVLLRIAKLNEIPTQVIDDIEQVFAAEVAALGDASAAKAGGLTVAADILKRLNQTQSAELIDMLSSHDQGTADELRNAMFTFEDLLRIESRGMQMLLKEVQTDKLVMALKNASDDLKEKIFGNISSRAAQMLREELDMMGPVRLSDVEAAQQAIVEVALNLEKDKKINIAREGGGDFV